MNKLIKSATLIAVVGLGLLSINASANTTTTALHSSPMSATTGVDGQLFAYHQNQRNYRHNKRHYRHNNRVVCFWTRHWFKYHFKRDYKIGHCRRFQARGHYYKACKVCKVYYRRYSH